jgi:hypothetical protein
MSGHTPGPWTVHGRDEGPTRPIIVGCPGVGPLHRLAAVYQPTNKAKHSAEANARLIAAAPDLLDALQFAAMALSDIATARRKGYLAVAEKRARAAIAKATRP